jgi:hypothetical protein
MRVCSEVEPLVAHTRLPRRSLTLWIGEFDGTSSFWPAS